MNILVYQPRVSYYIGGGEVVPLMHLHYLSKIGNKCTLVTTRSKKRPFTDLFQDFLDKNTDIKIVYIDIPEYLEWIYLEEPGNSWLRWDNESIFVSKIALPIINDINCDIYVAREFYRDGDYKCLMIIIIITATIIAFMLSLNLILFLT